MPETEPESGETFTERAVESVPPSDWRTHTHDAFIRGRRLRYVDVGSGPPVMLVHGLGASWRTWSGNMPALASHHRLIVVDLPGFGQSESLRLRAEIGEYAEVLCALLDVLGIERVGVVGHSLGGVISEALAVEHPERLDALVLVASGGGRVPASTKLFFRALALATIPLGFVPRRLVNSALRSVMTISPVRYRLLSRAVHDPALVTAEVVAGLLPNAFSFFGIASAISAGLRASLDVDLRGIQCPVLVISGQEDRLVPATTTERLVAVITHAEHQVWPSVGHHPMWERPTEFVHVVLRFLETAQSGERRP